VARPVVLVLEDLHWGDLPTIKLVDAALGALSDQPLMVLALARTTVHEIFPKLWADRCVQEIRLRKLSRRASEQLVRQTAGEAADEEVVKDLEERSQGHAAYLEQLSRAARTQDATPQIALAMVQARIEKLDPEARRVLRAASIFGDTFWRGGVEAILGGGDIAAWLSELAEQDMVVIHDEVRFPSEVELRFRQSLVREAVYATLTEADRASGHRLAKQWLERVGETDDAILKVHRESSGSSAHGPQH
jgi:eukaryotic-like serine/threonine-protein kinase